MISHASLSRRGALRATAAGVVAAASTSGTSTAQAQATNKMTYVLVPPAWHGGWCWKKVKPLLQERGHDVYTPTLTGLGERSHLAHQEIGLDIHIHDIVNVLKYEDLSGVILVGHSSSGMVITGVADRVPELLSHLVYVDAFVPEDGQSMWDIIPPDRRPAMEALVKTEGNGWLLPRFAALPWEKFVPEVWRVTDEADLRWMLARLGPTPFGTLMIQFGARIPPPKGCRARKNGARSIHTRDSIEMQIRHVEAQAGAIASWLAIITQPSPIRASWLTCY